MQIFRLSSVVTSLVNPVSASLSPIFIFIKRLLPQITLDYKRQNESTFSLENIMISNAENNDNVASFDSRFLVGFSSEADLLAVVHAFFDVNFQNFLC